ncbi:MAG TPA: chemotaxis response regulator protein-glutamate methylesterase [Gemmataceae bacterium]|nr:chemotaxis response regulator protein-glutamate methylesterase [Gemmataceae bacterium]
MGKIRVLVVDDAVVVRRMVTDVLAADPALEVAGTAANGRIALAKIPQVNPDIVTLDVEMPEMNGLETLAAIRKLYPLLPVIMFSTLTERGAATTIDALSLGANDYVTKPANVGSVAEALQCLRDQLVPKVKLWCTRMSRHDTVALRPGASFAYLAAPRKGAVQAPLVDALAIGVSTGGPNALSALLPQLPGDLPVPTFIVQHMPPVFTKLLAERLATQSALKVSEAVPGSEVRPGHVYVAPGDYHMVVKSEGVAKRIRTNQEPQENSCRPAVDVLFRSVVDVYGPGTLGVILTGMGQDGLRGCECIREVGGQILAQDEASSVVWGMPGFVARAGLADAVVPLGEVAGEIVRRVQKGRTNNAGWTTRCT